MRALRTYRSIRPALTALAREPESPWAAMAFSEDVPPATLEEARAGRSALARLLSRERSATADFLLALADFDRRRGWERLGHASLFGFLTRELGLSAGSAQLRLSAARLLPRHPAVEAALRDGRLCISAVGQLARVLTPENEADVLPRFFGRSAREAMDVVAELAPRPAPPVRAVVTSLLALPAAPSSTLAPEPQRPRAVPPAASAAAAHPLHTCEVPTPTRVPASAPAVEPLSADLRRLHLTVSKGFLDKVASARTGLSHARPGATTEQVLEAALDLLLERQARSRALVKRPRTIPPARAAAPAPGGPAAPAPVATPRLPDEPPATPGPSCRPHLPAAVEREVRLRDGDRCQFPLDGGGSCGSTWQVELDHVVPLALGGATEVGNLRCLCSAHHRRESERVLGPAAAAQRAKRRSNPS